jgi:hypothetical protein
MSMLSRDSLHLQNIRAAAGRLSARLSTPLKATSEKHHFCNGPKIENYRGSGVSRDVNYILKSSSILPRGSLTASSFLVCVESTLVEIPMRLLFRLTGGSPPPNNGSHGRLSTEEKLEQAMLHLSSIAGCKQRFHIRACYPICTAAWCCQCFAAGV